MFPQRIDNTYLGQNAALWLLGLILLIRMAMSFNCIFNGYAVATKADGFLLANATPAAVQAVVYLFAAWGLAQLAISLAGLMTLVRYRSAVPLLYALLVSEFVARKVIGVYIAVERTANSPAHYVNSFLLASLCVGLALSLWPRTRTQTALAS